MSCQRSTILNLLLKLATMLARFTIVGNLFQIHAQMKVKRFFINLTLNLDKQKLIPVLHSLQGVSVMLKKSSIYRYLKGPLFIWRYYIQSSNHAWHKCLIILATVCLWHGIKQLCNTLLWHTIQYPTCHLYLLGKHTGILCIIIARKYKWLVGYSIVYHSRAWQSPFLMQGHTHHVPHWTQPSLISRACATLVQQNGKLLHWTQAQGTRLDTTSSPRHSPLFQNGRLEKTLAPAELHVTSSLIGLFKRECLMRCLFL